MPPLDCRAAELGVESVTLPEIFSRAHIVSNHIPDLDGTRGTLNAALFDAMREGATFINTGRGAFGRIAHRAGTLMDRPCAAEPAYYRCITARVGL